MVRQSADKICIITTGGTFDKVYYDTLSDYCIGEPQITPMLMTAGVATKRYKVVPLLKKDSLEMDDADRALLREYIERSDSSKFLIVHGTDTMPETAQSLSGFEQCTIVLVGAMQPARFTISDATFNAGFAFAATLTLPPGVYVAMHGEIFHADNVAKNREAGRFETKNAGD